MRKRNCNGSALAWVVIVMMLLFFVMIFTMSLASGYHARSAARNRRRQVSLTASSLAEALGEDFVNHSWDQGGAAGHMLKELEGQHGTVVETAEQIVEGMDPSMGECRVKAVYDKDTRLMKLTVTCVEDEQTETGTVFLENIPSGKIDYGFDGIRAGEWSSCNLVEVWNSREYGSPAFDVWITGENGVDLAGEEKGVIGGAGKQGTLYCNGPVYQSSPIKGNHAPVLGSIVSGSSIELTAADNDFSIQSENPYYSLQACAPGKRSSISLSGQITVDSPENKKRMTADEITLSGPAATPMVSEDGLENEERMVIYSRLEGKQKIRIEDCVTIENNIHSEGDILIEGNGCRIGSEDSRSEIKGKNIRIEGGREYGSPVEIYGTLTALDSIVIEAKAPVLLHGDLIAGGSVELTGNIRVEGKIISKHIMLLHKENHGGQVWLDGSLFASNRISVKGCTTEKAWEDEIKEAKDGKKYSLMGMEKGENIYLYGENPCFYMEGSAQIGSVWSNGTMECGLSATDFSWHGWTAEDGETAKNLKAAASIISLLDSVELPAVLLTVQLPGLEQADTSRIGDPVGFSFDGNGKLSLESNHMEVTYCLVYPELEEDEEGEAEEGVGSDWEDIKDKSNQELKKHKTGKAAYQDMLENSGLRVDAKSGADSYLLIETETELLSFDGYAGNRRDPNSYIVLHGKEGSILSVAESLSGYVYGDGVLRLEDGCEMWGICDVERLETGENVTFTYCPLNSGIDSLFTPNWKVIRYGE